MRNLVLTSVFCMFSGLVFCQEILTNAGFETGDGTGWTVVGYAGVYTSSLNPGLVSTKDNNHEPGGSYYWGISDEGNTRQGCHAQYVPWVSQGQVQIQCEVGKFAPTYSQVLFDLRYADGDVTGILDTLNMSTLGTSVESVNFYGSAYEYNTFWTPLGQDNWIQVNGPITIWCFGYYDFASWACGSYAGMDGFWVTEASDVHSWVLY